MTFTANGTRLRDVAEAVVETAYITAGDLASADFDDVVADVVAHEAADAAGEALRRAELAEQRFPRSDPHWSAETRWFFDTATAQALERLGSGGRARRRHEAALGAAQAGGFDYGVERSRLHLARVVGVGGDSAASLDLITEVLDGTVDPDPEVSGLASAALGWLLHDMRAGALATRYLEIALDQIPASRRRTRIGVLQDLVWAALDSDQVELATRAYAELADLVPAAAPNRDELLRPGRAALHLAAGNPSTALEVLDEVTEAAATRRVSDSKIAVLRLRSLNELGRFGDAIDAMWLDDRIDEDVVMQLARAHEGLGQLRQAYLLERRASDLRSQRAIGMTALLPVVDEMAMSGVLSGTSQQLSARSAQQERDNERFNLLTASLLDDLQAKVNALDAVARRASADIDGATMSEFALRAYDLADAVSALDQRPQIQPDPSGVRTCDVLERLCRTLEPAAAQRRVRIEHLADPAGSEPGGWQYYSAWRRQVAETIRVAPAGSIVQVQAAGPDLDITLA